MYLSNHEQKVFIHSFKTLKRRNKHLPNNLTEDKFWLEKKNQHNWIGRKKVYPDAITEYKSVSHWGQVSCLQMLTFSQRTVDIDRKEDESVFETVHLPSIYSCRFWSDANDIQYQNLLLSQMWKCIRWMAKKRPWVFIYHKKELMGWRH